MNIRFEPTQLLDVKDLQYCEFCSQAIFSRSVHDEEHCILNDLCLNDSLKSHTKTLNFSFYQCFLKNCTLQVTNSDDFISHLKKHGIMLEGTNSKSKHKYKCLNCSYKTTQQRYLDSHNRVCTENSAIPDTSDIHDLISGSSSSKSTTENDNSKSIPESSAPTPLQKFPSQDQESNKDDISSSLFTKKSHGYSCTNCSYSTTQRRYLEKHRTVCSKSDELKSKEVQIPCNRCSYVAQNTWALEVHMQSHTISQLAPNLDKKDDKNDESDLNQVNFSSADTILSAGEVGKTEVHKCTDCSFKTKNLALFNLHAKSCIRNKNKRDSVVKQKIAQVVLKRVISVKVKSEKLEEFKCEFCSFSSKSKLRVNAHRASHFRKSKGEKNRKTGQISSSLWKKTHTNNSQLSMSSKSHVFHVPKLRCSFCPFQAKLSIMTKHHEKKCNSVLYRKFRCQTCSDVFSSQDMLNRHITSCKIILSNKKTSNPSRIRLRCEKCSFVTCSKLVFAQHSSTCGIFEFEQLRCHGCCHIFSQKFSLQRHLTKSTSCAIRHEQVESNRLNLKCGKCSYQALNQASFVVHEALCGNKNFKRCYKCSFVAKSQYLYKKHVHASCNKSFQIRRKLRQCQKCSKMIKCTLYGKHTQRCGNSIYDAYKCPHKDCSFVGVEENGLRVHIGRCHSIQKPPMVGPKGSEVSAIRTSDGKFRCSLCPYTSAIKPRVETHIKLCLQMHNGNKTIIKCDQSGCPFLCKSIKGLSAHRRAHKERPSAVNSVKSIDHIGANSSSVEDKLTSVKLKKQSAIRNYSKLFKCDKCPYSTAISKKQLLVHKALCFLKQSGTSEIIQCEYPNCHYLTETIGSYKKHYKMKHSLSTSRKVPTKTKVSSNLEKTSKKPKKPLAANAKITCSNCPYSCRFRATLEAHKLLCSRKLSGDPTVLACNFPGCHHLAKSQHAMNVHFGRYHHKRSTNFQEEITSPNVSESAQLDSNLGDKISKSADNSSMMPTELKSSSPSKAFPSIISFKHEPQTVDYYCCSRCSFRCLQSDTALIDSHKENCRTQLFEKFQLPAKDIQRVETTNLNKPYSYPLLSEPKVSPLQLPLPPETNSPVDTVEAVPLKIRINQHSSSSSKVDDLNGSPDTPTKLEALVPSSVENIAQKSNFMDRASSTDISSQSAREEIPELDAYPYSDTSLKECDLFASDGEDDLSLCLDSEYFI